MNLIEACKSGKRFKRVGMPSWFDARRGENVVCTVCLSYADIISGDWECEEVAVSVTREQLTDAFRDALGNVGDRISSPRLLLQQICKELGLE